MSVKIPAVVLGIGLSGCGWSRMPDLTAYQDLASDVSAAVARHQANSATLDAAACPGEASRYEAEVRPMLQHMEAMSVAMDAHMRDMALAGSADLQVTCLSMMAELDAHLAAACSASDIPAEASRHGTAMDAMLQHELADMAVMQAGSMMSGGCR